ncbi:acyltransferase [Allohahella marinimesophila]|uniref:acyltransferase n=1 Tax=Allohahella marinimesophila TaxID=1054972 RepID=UPI0031D40A84
MKIITNILLVARDVLKDVSRCVEQVLARIYFISRGPGTSVALSVRLDIGKKISFRKQPELYPFLLGAGGRIESGAVINSWQGAVTIGENSRVGIGSILIGPITIGENTGISQYCFVSGENRNHSGGTTGLISARDSVNSREVVIGSGVWVGAGVIILPGVKVGDRSVIGAGSVVVSDVPSDVVVAGVPARPIIRRAKQ